jgi:hypothetical protein
MEGGMQTKKKLLFLSVTILLVLLIGTILASTFWHMRIQWTFEDTSIGSYKDLACANPWTFPLSLSGVSEAQSFDFYIKNEGNVVLNVTVVNEVISGGSANWSPKTLSNLAIGQVSKMTLTLTFTGDGSYDFDFKSEKAFL